MAWETVVGLEVHVQLLTRSKMFCGCSAAYGDPPNTNVCPVCLGLPGALPVPNERAVRLAVRAAFALGCAVQPRSIFARKNYFYPDLPKGYQISQFEEPLATGGRLDVVSPERGPFTVGIKRLHLEEDSGKSFHDRVPGMTAVDFNRSGVPLIEIVSEPDLRSPAEARAYLTALKQVLRWIEVSDCNMEEGSLRVDANLSVRRSGEPLGTRTEVKNVNSFSNVERALAFEQSRQIALIEGGGAVEQRTMTFDAASGEVRPTRSKEESHDYRYFPEPDLPPLVVEPRWVQRIAATLPELPYAKYQRFMRQYGLNSYNAGRLTEEQAVADYFEQAAVSAPPESVANMILGELFSLVNQSNAGAQVPDAFRSLKVGPASLAELVQIVADGKINLSSAKEVLGEMFASGRRAPEIVKSRGLEQVSDQSYISGLVAETLSAHPIEVASYRAGKTAVSNFLFGQVMKKAAGKANPQVVRSELERQLLQ